MNQNIRIARQLLRIARNLAADGDSIYEDWNTAWDKFQSEHDNLEFNYGYSKQDGKYFWQIFDGSTANCSQIDYDARNKFKPYSVVFKVWLEPKKSNTRKSFDSFQDALDYSMQLLDSELNH